MIHLYECRNCGHVELRLDNLKALTYCPICTLTDWQYRGYISPLRAGDTVPTQAAHA